MVATNNSSTMKILMVVEQTDTGHSAYAPEAHAYVTVVEVGA